MKRRVAKKIVKNKDRLKYSKRQTENAQKVMNKIKSKNKQD